MSNSARSISGPLEVPSSSKKRKNASEVAGAVKKKRKHDKSKDTAAVEGNQAVITKDKKDKKRKKKENLDSQLEMVSETQDSRDVEIPHATDLTLLASEHLVEEDQEVNGTGLSRLAEEIEEEDDSLLHSQEPSCFYEQRLSLQLPIPAVSLASPEPSILSLHLAPLLLTYFQPAEGIVLSYSDPVLSAAPSHGVNLPLKAPKSGTIPRSPPFETFAKCADGFGVCWVWLTATFLVFRPQPRDNLKGWINVSSEGFVGLVSYNYFQAAVGKSRIPTSWIWDGPAAESYKNRRKARKIKLRDEDGFTKDQEADGDSQEAYHDENTAEQGVGVFTDAHGNNVSATQIFHVVDVEMVPGHERDKWTLQIDGSLLPDEEEAAAMAGEKQRFEQIQHSNNSKSRTPASDAGDMPLMSGALPFSRIGSPS